MMYLHKAEIDFNFDLPEGSSFQAWIIEVHQPLHHTQLEIVKKSTLSINAFCACVYIYIRQLSYFRAPTLWFIDLTVATCHIQYTFLSLCQFFHEKTDKIRKYSKSAIFVWYENGRQWLLGAQSINTERASMISNVNIYVHRKSES